MPLVYKRNEISYQDNKPVGTVSEHLQAHVKFRKMLEFKHYPWIVEDVVLSQASLD